jgi:hypothetical protein
MTQSEQLIPIAIGKGPGLDLEQFKKKTRVLVFGDPKQNIDANPVIKAIIADSENLQKQAQDLQVINDEGEQEAKTLKEKAKDLLSRIENGFSEPKKFFDKAHKHVCALQRETSKTANEAGLILDINLKSYLTAKQSKIVEENRKAQAAAEREKREALEKAKKAKTPERRELLTAKAQEIVAPVQEVKKTWWDKNLEIRDKHKLIQYLFENMPEAINQIVIPHTIQKDIIDRHFRPGIGQLGDDKKIRQNIFTCGCVIVSQQRQ